MLRNNVCCFLVSPYRNLCGSGYHLNDIALILRFPDYQIRAVSTQVKRQVFRLRVGNHLDAFLSIFFRYAWFNAVMAVLRTDIHKWLSNTLASDTLAKTHSFPVVKPVRSNGGKRVISNVPVNGRRCDSTSVTSKSSSYTSPTSASCIGLIMLSVSTGAFVSHR